MTNKSTGGIWIIAALAAAWSTLDLEINVPLRPLRPEVREYERTTTTVANAYVKPLATKYISRLLSGLRSLGFRRELLIMLSSGGMTSVDTATEFPVRIVESGPTAGAIAAAFMGKLMGEQDNLLSFDMGGTTAKGCECLRNRAVLHQTCAVAWRIYAPRISLFGYSLCEHNAKRLS